MCGRISISVVLVRSVYWRIVLARLNQLVFVVSLVSLCWFGIMALHELGHVTGAALTGGRVTRVVLHPAAISRTDVAPNPSPAIVVWAGPVIGCLLPLIPLLIPQVRGVTRKMIQFFAGFSLIANGGYIGVGSFDGVGDAGEMLRCGTPFWVILMFGGLAVTCGLWLWHRLGSLMDFLGDPNAVAKSHAWSLAIIVAVVIFAECLLSPVS